jgi:hypothetical protein
MTEVAVTFVVAYSMQNAKRHLPNLWLTVIEFGGVLAVRAENGV